MSSRNSLPSAQFERLKRLTNQQATLHAALRDHYSFWNLALASGGFVSSVALLSFVLVSDEFILRTTGISPDAFRWLMAILAILNVAITSVALVWRPEVQAAAHAQAVRHYALAKHAIHHLESSDRDLSLDELEKLTNAYLDDRDLPHVPEHRFLELKRWHLIKLDLSKEIDKNPHDPLWLIRLRVWWRHQKSRNQVAEVEIGTGS